MSDLNDSERGRQQEKVRVAIIGVGNCANSFMQGLTYYREHVGPWVRRRLTGTSSGDGRAAKFGEWTVFEP